MTGGSEELELRICPPFLPEDRAEIAAFLAARGLAWEEDPDYSVLLLRGGRIVGTGSLAGRVIKLLAVDESLRGAGLAATVVSELEAEAARRGQVRPLVFTNPGSRAIFESLGYEIVGEAPGAAVLLEKGGGIGRWCAELRAIATASRAAAASRAATNNRAATGSRREAGGWAAEGLPVAALVMNCNPFTLGHLHLATTAAAASSLVFLFVVSEEASSFPFDIRLRLIREGTAELRNLIVVPGSEYLVSRATFPTYFLKDRAGEATAIHARLDVDVFGSRIAPAVGAVRRFIGEEPYSEVTAVYNRVMKSSLPSYGIEVVEIPRLEADREKREAVSASTVRRLIRENRLEEARRLVPPSTWDYLVSEEARPVLARVAATEGRH